MLQWKWSERMGSMTIKQNGQKFIINLYNGNALAIGVYEYEQDGKQMYQMHWFLSDEEHCKNLIKDKIGLLPNDCIAIQLNAHYPNARKLAKILMDNGYELSIYNQPNK